VGRFPELIMIRTILVLRGLPSLALMSFKYLPLGIYLCENLHMVIVNGVYMQVFITFQGPTLKHVHMLKLIA